MDKTAPVLRERNMIDSDTRSAGRWSRSWGTGEPCMGRLVEEAVYPCCAVRDMAARWARVEQSWRDSSSSVDSPDVYRVGFVAAVVGAYRSTDYIEVAASLAELHIRTQLALETPSA